MILVLASELDRSARALVERWPDRAAALLTVNDVAGPGLRVAYGREADSVVRVAGRDVHARELRGVITRLPGVIEEELYRVVAEDRAYVAAELQAFLAYWLSALPCPVLNRPSPTCLAGPSLRPEQWILAAARAGLTVRSLERTTATSAAQPAPAGERFSMVVVGDACFGPADASLRAASIALVRAVGAVILELFFEHRSGEARFVGVSLLPDLSEPARLEALLACCEVPR